MHVIEAQQCMDGVFLFAASSSCEIIINGN